MRNFLKLMLVGVFLFALVFSCKESGTNNEEPPAESPYELETRTGQVVLPEGSTIAAGDLEVVSSSSTADVNADGSFSVQATKADQFQLLFFRSKTSKKLVVLGVFDPNKPTVVANDSSTVLAMILFNPYLMYSTQTDRQNYLEKAVTIQTFNELVQKLDQAYLTDAGKALDYESNPAIFQLSAQLMKETLQSLSGGGRALSKTAYATDPPSIQDVSGTPIQFVNERHVYYAAGIHPDEGAQSDVVSIDRVESIVDYYFGWPPYVYGQPAVTDYDLGNGYFKIYVTKGGDFSTLGQWDTPEGRATTMNAAQMVTYMIDLIMGHTPLGDVQKFGEYFTLDARVANALTSDIIQGNMTQMMTDLGDMMKNNAHALALWVWQGYQAEGAEAFMTAASDIFSKVTFVFEILGYGNEQAPFIWDLIFAQRDVTYYVTQQNGSIVSTEQNDAPAAEFTVSPPAGVVTTEFTFDASATTDDIDAVNALQFRWDWESDGTWDVGWSSQTSQTHTFAEAGSYVVTLEVKDSGGLVGSITHNVNVGGGAGTASHVKLFRDNLPWDSNAMVDMLESLGFTEGSGADQYEILTSAVMDSVELIPGQDLVIISNDQIQTFYDNYAANQVKFTNFVYMGGSIFWEACDQGWNSGSMTSAGIVLPGNITNSLSYDYYNYVTDQNLPLVSGLPDTLDHNYASHESFSNLPDGTTVYCVNSQEQPTLIEFNLGGGWALISGQPLEHQYDHLYGNPDMEQLLPRIVSYFTGKEFTGSLAKRTLPKSTRSSAGTK